MDNETLHTLTHSVPFFLTMAAQGTLLLLPVDLKNWDDDLINAFSYVAFQVFLGGILFFGIPVALDNPVPTPFLGSLILGTIFFASWFRVIRLIPLEFVLPAKPNPQTEKSISFVELFDPQRLSSFANLPLQDAAEEARYLQLHERLIKRRPAKVETAKDGPSAP